MSKSNSDIESKTQFACMLHNLKRYFDEQVMTGVEELQQIEWRQAAFPYLDPTHLPGKPGYKVNIL